VPWSLFGSALHFVPIYIVMRNFSIQFLLQSIWIFLRSRSTIFTHLLFQIYLFPTPPNCAPNPRRALRLLFARPTASSTRRPRPTVQLLTYPSGGTLPLRENITTYSDGILLSIRSLISESSAEECGGGCGEAPT
jgi:hypothetical protein